MYGHEVIFLNGSKLSMLIMLNGILPWEIESNNPSFLSLWDKYYTLHLRSLSWKTKKNCVEPCYSQMVFDII